MAEALLSKPENQKPTIDIPKSRELFRGDINDAVIRVQKITGVEIDPDWWHTNVGNEGSTENILDRFDEAYAHRMFQEPAGTSFSERQRVHPEYDEKVLWNMFEKKSLDDIKAEEQLGYAHLTYLDQEPTSDIKGTIKDGLQAIEQRLGPEVTAYILGGLEIVVGHDLESEKGRERGGRAFPHRKLVILNGPDTQVTLGELEAMLAKPDAENKIKYENGDLTEDFGIETKSGKITTVHEIGHVFDALAHKGYYGGNPSVFDRRSAPTKHGEEGEHEDYADSFMYYVIKPDSKRLSADRKRSIDQDIKRIKLQIELSKAQVLP